MKKAIYATCIAILLIALSLAIPNIVKAHYGDSESTGVSAFSSTTLDANMAASEPLFDNADALVPGDLIQTEIMLENSGILPFNYSFVVVITNDANNFCSNLSLRLLKDGVERYSGTIIEFNANGGFSDMDFMLASGESSPFVFEISVPEDLDSSYSNAVCTFSIEAHVNQQGFAFGNGYYDQESANGDIGSGVWHNAGSVVINELMWAGSKKSAMDEWIELWNTTSSSVDLTGWTLENAGSGGKSLTLSGAISPGEYFLISNYSSENPSSELNDTILPDIVISALSLVNTGEEIILKDNLGREIDRTPTGKWAAGINGPPDWHSMERNSDPSTGWHTCTDAVCNDGTYWDTNDGASYGTPQDLNHSENDPSGVSQEEEDNKNGAESAGNENILSKDQESAQNAAEPIKELLEDAEPEEGAVEITTLTQGEEFADIDESDGAGKEQRNQAGEEDSGNDGDDGDTQEDAGEESDNMDETDLVSAQDEDQTT